MSRRILIVSFIIACGLGHVVHAGERYLLDREASAAGPDPYPETICATGEGQGRAFFMSGGGRIWPYRWSAPVLEGEEPLPIEAGRILSVPIGAPGQWLLALAKNGQDYVLWHKDAAGGTWAQTAGGNLGGKVSVLTSGRFTAGEGAGLFSQDDSGRIGYWQVDPGGCLKVWLSPEPWPKLTAAFSADFDGDGLDEVLAVQATGALVIARWDHGLWENAWSLPPWGQVLAVDYGQADNLPGVEAVVATSQRMLFLVGASGGAFTVKSRLTMATVVSHAALVPGTNGDVILSDAAGNVDLYCREAETWRFEARLLAEERLAFLAGLAPGLVLAGNATGGPLRILRIARLADLAVYLDGTKIENSGLYWQEGKFYFGAEILQRALGIKSVWDAKKSTLTLTLGRATVVLMAGKSEAMVNGRPWPLSRSLALVGKIPYVPSDLLRSVFLVNVTFDPAAGALILTSAAPG